MNETIERILAHRSVRDFEDRALTPDQIETIVKCAQSAATSSFMQAYSIIGVTDIEKRQELARLAFNQQFMVDSGHLFVFCADLNRHEVAAEMEGIRTKEHEGLEASIASTEKFMVAVIDAALAAQNAALAAESMGLGICYVGGLRNDLERVGELLHIPEKVIPLFGMAIGYPKVLNEQKPRLPLAHVYHENSYQQGTSQYRVQLEEYNATIQAYYETRTQGGRGDTWTGQMAKMMAQPRRMYMQEYVHKKGLNQQ